MLSINFETRTESTYKILCLGAHSDDIEIGCGGTILKLQEAFENTHFHWVVFSSSQDRAIEARRSADAMLQQASTKTVVIKDFRTSFFPYLGIDIKEYFEEIKRDFSPDLILTHYRNDLHQDHRLISELTWNAFRDHLIFEYEIPKYDGDFGSPNVFVPLDESVVSSKIDVIIRHFQSQQEKHWFDRDIFLAILRLRGMESCSPTRYAEAFYCRKMIWGAGTTKAQ
jgi:LmbE family N-acetylglucosaminyl deacetylase